MSPNEAAAVPTQPRPRTADGLILDEFNLPICGPARFAALGGKPDPREAQASPSATASASPAAAPAPASEKDA